MSTKMGVLCRPKKTMVCCTLLCIHSSIAMILMGKRELVALLNFSSWCLVMVAWLFLAVPQGCLWFVIVVFPDHTYYSRPVRQQRCSPLPGFVNGRCYVLL